MKLLRKNMFFFNHNNLDNDKAQINNGYSRNGFNFNETYVDKLIGKLLKVSE